MNTGGANNKSLTDSSANGVGVNAIKKTQEIRVENPAVQVDGGIFNENIFEDTVNEINKRFEFCFN